MKIINPSYEILSPISENGMNELKLIEKACRTCYKSEQAITEDGSSAEYITKLVVDCGHEAMIEHSFLSVKFVCDRAIANELVRHRLCSFAQESTRYCNYSSQKFGGEITVIRPLYLDPTSEGYKTWAESCAIAESAYFKLLDVGYRPQEARAVLPLSLKTEIVVTANYREWRHLFKLRCDETAHPQMRELLQPLLASLIERLPVIFGDLENLLRRPV